MEFSQDLATVVTSPPFYHLPPPQRQRSKEKQLRLPGSGKILRTTHKIWAWLGESDFAWLARDGAEHTRVVLFLSEQLWADPHPSIHTELVPSCLLIAQITVAE